MTAKKCKILHLPTGQYMYWDSDCVGQYEYFYSQYKKETEHNNLPCYKDIFRSKTDAIKYIKFWVNLEGNTECFIWCIEDYDIPLRKEHFEIVGVDNV